MPGTLITIDITTASAENTSAKIDAAIQHKLFKVLPCHIGVGEHVTVEPPQNGLLQDICTQLSIPNVLQDDLLQLLGDTLRAGLKPVALRCPACSAWQLDIGAAAI